MNNKNWCVYKYDEYDHSDRTLIQSNLTEKEALELAYVLGNQVGYSTLKTFLDN